MSMTIPNAQLLKCPICNNEYSVLATHIIRTHHITTSSFRDSYPNVKLTTEEFRHKLSSTAKNRFIENPELRKIVSSRTFDFVENDKLESLLSRDYKTAKYCLSNLLWKPSIILYGGIIEAILKEKTSTNDFVDALENSYKEGVISEMEYHKLQIVRDSRNFVHLHKEISTEGNGVINDYWAKTLSDICESLIKRLRKNNYK